MKFELIDAETFRKFAAKSPYKSFYQTPEIAKLREQNGWTAYYFGALNGTKLVAASMVVAKPTFLGKSIYYAPGGPLLDFEDAELTKFFFSNLRRYAKSHNGYLLHIEPYYELIERDRQGEIVKSGFNHEQAKRNLRAAGLTPCIASDEPKYAFVLDLNQRAPDELFKQFKQNTRNLIHRAEKNGVIIRELKREELDIFKQITESTSNRRDFQDKPLSYYKQMYDLFHKRGEVKFIVAEAPKDTLSRSICDDGNKQSEEPCNSRRDEAFREERVLLPISVAMFMLYGDEITYLFSGSDEKYMKEYNAQYLIQWHMIKYAATHKFKRYNFYGLQALPNESKKGYGIYTFKKGFASDNQGHVTELIGAHESPVNSTFYALHQVLHKLKSKLRP